MRLVPFHQRVLHISLPLCERFGLVLAGGYAVQAHGLLERSSQDLDFATNQHVPLEKITHEVAEAYRRGI